MSERFKTTRRAGGREPHIRRATGKRETPRESKKFGGENLYTSRYYTNRTLSKIHSNFMYPAKM